MRLNNLWPHSDLLYHLREALNDVISDSFALSKVNIVHNLILKSTSKNSNENKLRRR